VTLVIGLVLTSWFLSGVVELVLGSWDPFELATGAFVSLAAGFIGVVFVLDGWAQTAAGVRQTPEPSRRPRPWAAKRLGGRRW